MIKYFVCIFVISVSLFCISSISEAKRSGGNNNVVVLKSSEREATQSRTSSQRRSNAPYREERVPRVKPNRLEERRRKKAGVSRKRKTRRKKALKKKNRALAISKEEVGRSSIRNKDKPKEVKVKTERLDDVPLLISAMLKMGVQKIIDEHISEQKNQRDLSWGWTTVIWLSYILSEGDHRKVAVEEYVEGLKDILTEITGKKVEGLDLSDDRLTVLLSYLNNTEIWEKIEKGLSEKTIEAYELPEETARVDATTVSGYHKTEENGIFQFGKSKDDPDRPQLKIMTGCLEPLGMPLATDVVSGEQADDVLYSPNISRMSKMLKKSGILYVGDSKLSSFGNRLHIKSNEIKGHYLCPLANTGKTRDQMKEWIEEGIVKDCKEELVKYVAKNRKGKEEVKAKGYEIEREETGKEISWRERVIIVKSLAHEHQKIKGLERRLKNAEEKLNKLTPARGRGKRQIKEEKTLIGKIDAILKHHKVEGLLVCEYEKEVERKEKYKGKGRGSDKREKIVEEKVRYQITKVMRDNEKIQDERKTYGWKAYVTDVGKERLDFIGVVKCYRKQYSVERIFNRLKSRLHISPLYVKRDEQARGMSHLLTLGVRVYTLIEFVVRRSLKNSGEKLSGLHPENRKKETDTPTCERLLKAFSKISLTFIDLGGKVIRHLTPLSELQLNILRHFGADPAIYNNLGKLQI